ncbi:hypothetical protein LX97_00452 [Nonlabens dokdonensis]|jgi:hypothetical protein|uniref:2-dehydro-3-deoxyphosphooctonate aldolase n=2 Tax=Nonlabens dokdonensis TaxID=328515 RepID=L7W2Q7_NONDD|nr:hypothetical protein [Nonlabens dokdonensis]AGC75770.1 2-dehydro-3-deoxyphosphooctonate aldolase [Nonlabens dokdonensis DSW-6]PZX43452.1 hypothetical protein LX97_00452 [Nonlabens dokdonensis]
MKNIIYTILIALFITACGSQKAAVSKTKDNVITKSDGKHPQILVNKYAFLVEKYADDSSYGFEPENAIKVGGAAESEGPTNERRFLNALAGPQGEELEYYRIGSCCPQPSENSAYGQALLDKYAVYHEGSTDTLVLYINMYDSEKLMIPKGFKARVFPN